MPSDKNGLPVVPVRTKHGKWRFKDSATGKWTTNPGVDMNALDYVIGDVEKGESVKGDASFQYSGGSTSGLMSTVYKGLFEETVTDETLEDMYKRDEIAHAGLNKVARNLVDKFCHIKAFHRNGNKYERLEKLIEDFNRQWDVETIFRRAWKVKQVKGVCLIAFGLPGELDEPATRGPLSYLSVIPKSRINKFKIDLDPDSDSYGKVGMVEIVRATTENSPDNLTFSVDLIMDTPIDIHSSRFIHWHYPQLEDLDPMGMPGWLPLADVLTVKKNIDYATGEALWQFATRKYILITSPFTTEEDWTAIKEDWKNFKSTTNFAVRGEGIDIEEFGGEGQLDPRPYYEWFAENMGPAIGISRTHLVNTGRSGAGAIEARRNFERDINSLQKTSLEPKLRELYSKMMDYGVLPKGDLEFEWQPLTELSEEESAFIQSRHGLGRNLEMRAVETAIGSGLSVELDDKGHVVRFFVKGEGEEHDEHILHPPIEPKEKPERPPELPPEEETVFEEMLTELAEEIIKRKMESNE